MRRTMLAISIFTLVAGMTSLLVTQPKGVV